MVHHYPIYHPTTTTATRTSTLLHFYFQTNPHTAAMAEISEQELHEVCKSPLNLTLSHLNEPRCTRIHPILPILSDVQAFKLFDADGDGVITSEELKALVGKVT